MTKTSTDPAAREKKLQAWQKARERGKQFYILTRGVLGWGATTYFVFVLYRFFSDHDTTVLSLHGIVAGILVWGLFGYLVGLLTWNSNEKRYGNSN
jgi:hypothetical protein